MKNLKQILLALMLTVFAFSCGSKMGDAKSDEGKIKVTTTLNYYVNLLEEIGKDKVKVTGLMGEGEDPHLYVATAGDIEKLEKADLVVYGGLHLEGKMVEIFENLKDKAVLDLGAQLDPSKLVEEEKGVYDPHVWFNTEFWAVQATAVANKLSELDPANKEFYMNNLEVYLKELDMATKYVQDKINEIPENARVLITAHDAFGYFASQFGLEVKAIQGVSTDSEIGTKEINELADFIVANKIKAIFVESSVNHKSIESLQEAVQAKGFEVKIGGELYSDSMGDAKNNTETYIKTLKFNADTIANALK
ncbi:manganese transporter [Streptobacillus moniliformis]|uniref:Periplasmic solute binding protein n=2 Tax=Streptobacillus moniliformis TaxID=34105 RepID=D1AWN2_STRM9|nr:zinc ABC transporter substrate-binding protein [Streptobacillus moniliformis]ACZ00708.1 periplasmic solute binding protein [Streptobacillus moniliformis DSM 12112]AVL42893.1 manganese transporter [Streptobacillus moniliformis]SQA14164.1 Tromp-1 [Streptobacillus moniliformis]